MVDRVVIEGARAEALIVKSRGEDVELRADTILLSTGTHGTPPILMRSGVGPREVLKEVGIPESVVMEGVGAQPTRPPVLLYQLQTDGRGLAAGGSGPGRG